MGMPSYRYMPRKAVAFLVSTSLIVTNVPSQFLAERFLAPPDVRTLADSLAGFAGQSDAAASPAPLKDTISVLPGDDQGKDEILDVHQKKDYLAYLKIKFLKELRIPEEEADRYSKKLYRLHENLQKTIKSYYGDSEEAIRYTITPREWQRCSDEFLRVSQKESSQGTLTQKTLRRAFETAVQNVYFDSFPKKFIDATLLDEPVLFHDVPLPSAEKDRKMLNDVKTYRKAYEKFSRGMDTGKPLLLIREPDSFDTAEIVTDMYVREHKGVLVKVPVTPFTDRAQIIGTKVPRKVLSDRDVDSLLHDAGETDIKWALAVIRERIPHGSERMDGKGIEKATRDDYAEWLILKNTHLGLRRAVANVLQYDWAWNQKLVYEDGILSRMAGIAHKRKNQTYYLYLDNIDAAPPKVRAQLHQILLFGEMEVPDKMGGEKTLKLPPNLKLIFTMSDNAILEDAAFYNRFYRKHIDSLVNLEKTGKAVTRKTLSFLLKQEDKENLRPLMERQISVAAANDAESVIDHLCELSMKYPLEFEDIGLDHFASVVPTRFLEALTDFFLDHPDEALKHGYLTEAQIFSFLGVHRDDGADPTELINILMHRYAFNNKEAGAIVDLWENMIEVLENYKILESVNVGDLFTLASYIRGALQEAPKGFRSITREQLRREIIARESWLYFKNKLDDYFDKKDFLKGDIENCICKTIVQPRLFTFGSDYYNFDAAAHKLIINGIGIEIDESIHDEESLYEKTGMVLTSQTIKILSALIREQKFGNGVVILEGPTGIGKTFVTEAFAEITEREFYCEPIHGGTKIDRWLGYYKVDIWGNYSLFDNTGFLSALRHGGVIAASELNTKFNREGKASFGYWLIPVARGDKNILLTEYPRTVKQGKKYKIPRIKIHKNALVVIDINPEEEYTARGEIPDFLNVLAPSVKVMKETDEADVKKKLKMFLGKAALDDDVKEKIIDCISSVHIELDNRIDDKKIGTDSSYVLANRELKRVCEDIIRKSKEIDDEEKIARVVTQALTDHYAKFWLVKRDCDQAENFIIRAVQQHVASLGTNPFEVEKHNGLTKSEAKVYRFANDSLLGAGRPTMIIAPSDARPEKVVSVLMKENNIKEESMTMSYFTEMFHLVGGFVPKNNSIDAAKARAIIDRISVINEERVNDMWRTKLDMKLDVKDANDPELITLATVLNSLETGEEWNAKLEWREGLITRVVRKYASSEEIAAIVLRNFHRLKPKVAVALNEFLQGGQIHLEDGTKLILPDNIRILALAGSYHRLPISPAEQSRWVRTVMDELSAAEKEELLKEEVLRHLDAGEEEIIVQQGEITAGDIATSIISWVKNERSLLDNICTREDYFFTFWDDMALTGAIVENLKQRGSYARDDMQKAVLKERESVYGVALREQEAASYFSDFSGDNFINDGKGSISSDQGILTIDGISHPIIDTEIEKITREERLEVIPRLVAYERSMLSAFNNGRIVIMEGPPGGGKTVMPEDLAGRMGMESYLFSSHDRVDLSDFIGEFTQDETGDYVLTSLPDANGHYRIPFLEMYVHGGVFTIDEGAIGRRAQELIAWLGPILTGQKKLYLQEHPGRDVQELSRNKHFHIAINTNPYRDTPGREALPYEALAYAQKIWVRKMFTREDCRTILGAKMKPLFFILSLKHPAQIQMLDRMIDFHNALEERTGVTLGVHHTERYFIGIRDMLRWANDITRIYRKSENKNIEFAFVEGLMQNYNIYVEKSENKEFNRLVLEHLFSKKLGEIIDDIMGTLTVEKRFTLAPLENIFEAYQSFLDDDEFRRKTSELLRQKINAAVGFIPDIALLQFIDFLQRRVEEKAEVKREINDDSSDSTNLIELYTEIKDERAVDIAVETWKTLTAGLDKELDKYPDDRKHDMLPSSVDEEGPPGYCAQSFLDLMTILRAYRRFGMPDDLIMPVCAMAVEVLEKGDFTWIDLVRYLPDAVDELISVLASYDYEERKEAVGSLFAFVQKTYFGTDRQELHVAGLEIRMGFVRLIRGSNVVEKRDKHVREILKGLLDIMGSGYNDKYPASKVFERMASVREILPDKMRSQFSQWIERELQRDISGEFAFSTEDRIRIAIFLANEYKKISDSEQTAGWVQYALTALKHNAEDIRFGADLDSGIRSVNMSSSPNSSKMASMLRTTLGIRNIEELIEKLGKLKIARSFYIQLARASEGLGAAFQEEFLEEIRRHCPPLICESLYKTILEKKLYRGGNRDPLVLLCDDVLVKTPATIDFLELELRLCGSGIYERTKHRQAVRSFLEKIEFDLEHQSSELCFIQSIEILIYIIRNLERFDLLKKEEIIVEVFRKIAVLELETVDMMMSDRSRFMLFKLLMLIKSNFTFDTAISREVDRIHGKLALLTDRADKRAAERRSVPVTHTEDTVSIGYVRIKKGKPLEPDRVPKKVPWVKGIYSEERMLQFLVNNFDSHRPSMLICQSGSRPQVVVDRVAKEMNAERYRIDCYAGMNVSDLLGCVFPLLGNMRNGRKKLTQERGLLTTHLVEEADRHTDEVKKILVLYNIDFLSPKVRAALHNFLLKGYVYVNDDAGKRVKLVKPDSLHIIATMDSNSDKEMSDAFFNRFNRAVLHAFEMEKRRFSEMETMLHAMYGFGRSTARYIVRILYGLTTFDDSALWPSGRRYGFNMHDALALGRHFVQAKGAYKQKGENISDIRILCQEAMRLFVNGLSDAPDTSGKTDRGEFERLVLKGTFPWKDISKVKDSMVLDSNGRLIEMNNVRVMPGENADPIFEIDPYRLVYVRSLRSMAGAFLRIWQTGWDSFTDLLGTRHMPGVIIVTGETGVAKTTGSINLAKALGLKPYVYPTHQGSHTSDLTVDIAPDGFGGYYAQEKDFAMLLRNGECLLVVDEGNIKAQLMQTLAPIARGEKTLQLVLPGEGRRLKKRLYAVLETSSNFDEFLRKLQRLRTGFFGVQAEKFSEILDELDTRKKEDVIRKLYEFARQMRESGPIEYERGERSFVIVTQNPEMYAARDYPDAVITADARKAWAPSLYGTDEAMAIIRSFMGILDDTLIRNVSVVPADEASGYRYPSYFENDVPLDAYMLPRFLNFFKQKPALGWLRAKSKENQDKIAVIQRDVAFLTRKNVKVVPGNVFAISSDGKVLFVPYNQLLYSPPDVITGSIVHEIRHQRYSESFAEIEKMAFELLNEGEIDQQGYERLCRLTSDEGLNMFYQMAENVRTDSIKEPGFEGENDYLLTFRKEQFLDSRLEALPESKREKMKENLVRWATDFPDQVFITELCNLGYFGAYSEVFTQYPEDLQETIKRVSDTFLKATKDAGVHPDFERIDTEYAFKQYRRAAVKEFCKRIARDVLPMYAQMREAAQPAYEKQKKEAKKRKAEFVSFMEPSLQIEMDEDQRITGLRSKTEAQVHDALARENRRLDELLKNADDTRERSDTGTGISRQIKNLQDMQSVLSEVREVLVHMNQIGLSDDEWKKLEKKRAYVEKLFEEMIVLLHETVSRVISRKTSIGHKARAQHAIRAGKIMNALEKAEKHGGSIYEQMSEKSSLSDIHTALQSLIRTQKEIDLLYMGLARHAAAEEILKKARDAGKKNQSYIDELGKMLRGRTIQQYEKKVTDELLNAGLMFKLKEIEDMVDALARMISSDPLPDQLFEAQQKLSMQLFTMQSMLGKLSQLNISDRQKAITQELRGKILETLKQVEDLNRDITGAEGPDEEYNAEELKRTLQEITETAEKLKDTALGKTAVDEMLSCQKLISKELAHTQDIINILSTGGAPEDALAQAQKLRDEILQKMDDVNNRVAGETAKQQTDAGKAANPVMEEYASAREAFDKAEMLYKSIVDRKDEASIKEIVEQLKLMIKIMKGIAVCLHKISYLCAEDNVMKDVFYMYRTIREYTDDLLKRLSVMHGVRAEENKEKIAGEIHLIDTKYREAQSTLSKISSQDSIVHMNLFEHKLLEFVNILNKRMVHLARMGITEDDFKSVLRQRERILQGLFKVEMLLRDKRMVMLRGTESSRLETLVATVMRMAQDSVNKLGTDPDSADAERVLSQLEEYLASISQLLAQMFAMGGSIGIIREAITVRDTIAGLCDHVCYLLSRTIESCPMDGEKRIEKISLDSARLLRKAQEKFDEVSEQSETARVSHVVNELGKFCVEMTGLLRELSMLAADSTVIEKGIFVRNDMYTMLDETGFILHGIITHQARMAEQAPPLQGMPMGKMENPEEQLDEKLNMVLTESEEVMNNIQGYIDAKKLHKPMKLLIRNFRILNNLIFELSIKGAQESFIVRTEEARGMIRNYIAHVDALVRKKSEKHNKTLCDECKNKFQELTALSKQAGERISDISPPEVVAKAADDIMGYLEVCAQNSAVWSMYALESDPDENMKAIDEISGYFDEACRKLRSIIGAYKQITPPSSAMSSFAQAFGAGAQGAAGQAGAPGGTSMMGSGAAAAGGTIVGQGMAGEGAGKGPSPGVPLSQMPYREGEAEKDIEPLPVPERKDEPRPSASDEKNIMSQDLQEFGEAIKHDRLEEIRKDPTLQARISQGSSRARKDADQIIRLFKQRDADVEVDSAVTGLIVNAIRFLQGSREPFDIEEDILGDVSLALGVYVDNSGSIAAIKRYVADGAAYLIHLFEGISRTRTGRDKVSYAIKTFDTGLNSFKDFDEKITRDEAGAIPENVRAALGHGGTKIGTCIDTIVEDFSDVKEKTKVAILITDGQDTVPIEKARQAKEEGIILIGIGVGQYSANVANIFDHYLILGNPKNELPDAVTRLASMLAQGRKLPIGDLAHTLGIKIDVGVRDMLVDTDEFNFMRDFPLTLDPGQQFVSQVDTNQARHTLHLMMSQ